MTLRQTRIAFRLLFLLPAGLLGLTLMGVGAMRTVAEWRGDASADGTLSGLATMAVSLIPLGTFLLISWLFVRRPQKLPFPPPASFAPRSQGRFSMVGQLDTASIGDAASKLEIEFESDPKSSAFALLHTDPWHVGYLVALSLILAATWILPPSLAAGTLAVTPINVGLAVLGVWIGSFLLLLALPISRHSVEFRPESNTLLIRDGRRGKSFGLSRLSALEVRLLSESTRDSEIQQARNTRLHPALIGWFEVDRRGLTPFKLIAGPREEKRFRAESHRDHMQVMAEQLTAVLGVKAGPPEAADGEALPYES